MSLEGNLRDLRRIRQQVEQQLSGGLDAPEPDGFQPGYRRVVPPAELFGRRLRALRVQHNLKLEDVAQATGISKAYLSQVENGRVDPPRDDKLRRIEELFGQRPQSLIELAHLVAAPEDVRRRLELLKQAFERAEEVVGMLVSRLEKGTVVLGKTVGFDGFGDGSSWSATTCKGGIESRLPGVQSQSSFNSSSTIDGLDHANGRPAAAVGEAEVAAEAESGPAVGRMPPVGKVVPILNKAGAGYPAEFTDLGYPPSTTDEFISVPPGLDDPSAFAVRVVGDSMGPRYKEGDIVIFSPRADITSGDDCYVRFAAGSKAGDGATFKRVYFDDAETIRLQPLNDRFAPTSATGEEIDSMYRAICRYERL